VGYVDCRDWPRYNEALVRRGEIFLGLDAMEEWEEELEVMNRRKEGARFMFPDGFVRLLGFVRVLFHLPYRQTEGFVEALSRYMEGLSAPDYTTLNRRVNRLQVDLSLEDIQPDEPVTIAVDASGIKVANSGDWIRRVWKVRKGYLKIHIAVDVKSRQIVAMEVTDEKVGDNRMFKPLVKAAMNSHPVSRVLADGAYDAKENFNLLARHGVDPAIRVRSNSIAKARGSMARRQVVAERLKNPEVWRVRHQYGYRWRAEGVFSCMKRSFGEHVNAKKYVNMAQEMLLKAALYNHLTQMTANSHPKPL
jgi:IS5 family transposase